MIEYAWFYTGAFHGPVPMSQSYKLNISYLHFVVYAHVKLLDEKLNILELMGVCGNGTVLSDHEYYTLHKIPDHLTSTY